MLEFNILKGQYLNRLDKNVVSADTTDLKAQFDLTSDFTGTITAWWRRSDVNNTYTSTLAADGTCTIPAEALAATDKAVYGPYDHDVFVSISDTGRTTTNECKLTVQRSAFSTNATPGTGGNPAPGGLVRWYVDSAGYVCLQSTSAYRAVFGEDRSGFGQYPEGAGAWFAYPVHVNGGLMRTGSEYIHRANVAMGQSGYVKICTLQITTRYCDSPIEMLISQRGLGRPYTLYIQFRNSGGTDPGIESFKVTTTSGAYGATTEARLVKDAAGQWSLYLKKTEAWDDICVLDYRQDSMYNRIDVTWTDTFVGTVSGGTIAAVATDPQYLLKSGGTLTGNLTAPQFIGTLQGSAAKVNRLNQMLEESSGSDLTALMHRKVDLIRQIANGRDGVYCVHAGWSGHGWGFTIGAHYAGANVTDAVFFQGTEIDTIRLNGSTYGAVQRYMPGDEGAALIASMTDHINPATEAPELARQISMVAEQVAEMKDQIAALIADVATLKNPEGSEEGGGEETESDPFTGKIPDWEPWDGISDRYQRGAIVRENGEYYVNVLSGMQNTWQPGTAGVDDRYWIKLTAEQAGQYVDSTLTIDDVLAMKTE